MNIIMDSLPNKEKSIIWRKLINLKSVVNALEWLKINNRFYTNIKINKFENLPTDASQNEIDILQKNSLVIKENLSIEPMNVYSICEIDKISNKSEIEKYQIKHVENEPLEDNHNNMD